VLAVFVALEEALELLEDAANPNLDTLLLIVHQIRVSQKLLKLLGISREIKLKKLEAVNNFARHSCCVLQTSVV
jgi:hypothetical protein